MNKNKFQNKLYRIPTSRKGWLGAWIYNIPNQIIDCYIYGFTINEIAKMFGNCSPSTVYRLLIKYKTPMRNNGHVWTLAEKKRASQRRTGKPSGALGKHWKWPKNDLRRLKNMSGTNNPNWKGGLTKNPEHRKQQRRYHKLIRRNGSLCMPLWADINKIAAIYKQAKKLDMTVDHIIPLNHSKVCGLHCESNLQIISLNDNQKKSNKFIPG